MSDRLETIKKLVEFQEDIELIENSVKEFAWDYEEPSFILTKSNLIGILLRYLQGELDAEKVERWANLIECREDIDFEKCCAEELAETIFVLANPVLNGKLKEESCRELLSSLEHTFQEDTPPKNS